ncbi:hypothetical protein Tco_1019712 [Tanacetum coccineum]|uniref:Uncharacterized protein n=1 Tax=Tanacetum coccineum TaxID=301880 RepID=A0ABQ5FZV0_9ASTR
MDVLRNQTDEHVTPRSVANVDKLVLGEEKSQENFDPTFVNEWASVDNEVISSYVLADRSACEPPQWGLDRWFCRSRVNGTRSLACPWRTMKRPDPGEYAGEGAPEYKRSLGRRPYTLLWQRFYKGNIYRSQDPDMPSATPNVARAYLLDPTRLQNVMPDETGPTPGEGPRDTPTTSYA